MLPGSHTSPTISPDGTIYTSDGVYFYAFRPDGTIKWTKSIGAQDQNAPAVASNGDVYVGGYRAKLYAFSPTGTQKWVFESDESQYYDTTVGAAPAIGPDGTIYFGTCYSGGATSLVHFYAVSPDGVLKWKAPISGEGRVAFCVGTAPVVDRLNRVFVCTDAGKCYGYSSAGSQLWEYATDPTSPTKVRTAPLIASNGTLLILDDQDTLHALGDPTLPRLHVVPRPIQLMVDYNSPSFSVTLQITSTIQPVTWTAVMASAADWITVPVMNGSTPDSAQLSIAASSLTTGTYSADVWVTAGADNVAGSPIRVPIKLSVGLHRTYLPLVNK
jgi:hypothetical protein